MHVEVVPATGDVAGAVQGLSVVPAETLARWSLSGGIQVGSLVLARRDGAVVAAAFEVHRPLAAYRKIVEVWADEPGAAEAVVSEIEARAWREGAVAVKWEFRSRDEAGWAIAAARGYSELPVPELGGPVAGPYRRPTGFGRVLWQDGRPSRIPYMRQTTDFTCGPVALQMGLAALGLADAPTRAEEMRLWRTATTVGGCDPLGLGVAAALRGAEPEVVMSTEAPTLLELCQTDEERDLRGFLQAEFRAELIGRGRPARTEVFDLDTIREGLQNGAVALVLIEQLGMHAEASPHWITVHGMAGEVFLAHDPWTDAHLGESFVDAVDLPLPPATLDRLAWYGHPAYRGLVLLHRP